MASINKGYLEALVTFNKNWLSFGSSFIGEELAFSIDNNKLIILFPNFIKTESGHKITSDGTQIALKWIDKRHDGDISLGEPTSWIGDGPTQEVNGFSLNSVIVRSKKYILFDNAQNLRILLFKWKEVLIDWLETLGYVDLEDRGMHVIQQRLPEAYLIPTQKDKKLQELSNKDENSASITLSIRSHIDTDIMSKALKKSSNLEGPPEYYSMLIKSLKNFNQNKYRQSLLDSATAFEMAETELLDHGLSLTPLKQQVLIKNKYQQLVDLRTALAGMSINVPTEKVLKAKLAEPRNKSIHNGRIVDKQTAETALIFVKDFIYSSLPI